MKYRYVVMTPMMVDEEQPLFFTRVDEVLNLLQKHGVTAIELFFGWSWNPEWTSFEANVADIMKHIREQEQKTGADFGENDVYIHMQQLETRIVFCHEADLHLEFNHSNTMVRDILASWEAGGLLHCTRIDDKNVAWDEMKAEVFA